MRPRRTGWSRRIAIASVLAACLGTATTASAQTAAIPPLIRIVVPFGAGAGTDIYARAAGRLLAARLGTTVVVENKPGASTTLGADQVAKGPHDGSMLLLTTPSTLQAAATLKTVPFDLLRDLRPISMLNAGPMVVVVSSRTDIRTPADLVAQARARPDKLTYGSSGPGTMIHMAFEMFSEAAKIRLYHVPYKGGSFATADTAAGTVDMTLGAYSSFAPLVKAGRLRPIGITTGQTNAAFPQLPTMGSVAPGFALDLWLTLFAPAGLPPGLAQRLNQEFNEIAASKELQELTAGDGAVPTPLSLDELSTRMRDGLATWRKVAAERKIQLD